ncbi:NAD(P)-dependent alcohol dehydrogenase [Marinilongibacter aquaticus]|uniref:NAD(P)-dependent alcohol dehydrogenase n=1 Tax=Marinilongibacter aquaticus TaxID=2975157 RepID=UPI0021BD3B46|nr:NAD(P)-dependent alcohol dehydrogenase [Marinilongibacter aquaticus]UBM57820.1 NAD(P)-dependent alcohol dehydrogenase [Marinilongibacter aquaticus]
MKTAIRRNYCSPENIRIEEVETPNPQKDELLIKVKNTTVNRTDCANLSGKPFIMHFVLGLFKPKNPQIGTDLAGEVIKMGPEATRFKPGEAVMGFFDTGLSSQAEYACVSEKRLWPIPESISFSEAAASLEGAHYAYTFFAKSKFQEGQRILINGASGAIGSALLQFVRTLNVHITATCSPQTVSIIREWGADEVIDFTQQDFSQLPSEPFDYIFDTVGKSTFGQCKHLLTAEGVYISSELGPFAQNLFYALFSPILGGKKVIFPAPFPHNRSIPFILDHLKQGSFKPLLDKTFPFHRISEAYSYTASGQKTGNVLLEF